MFDPIAHALMIYDMTIHWTSVDATADSWAERLVWVIEESQENDLTEKQTIAFDSEIAALLDFPLDPNFEGCEKNH